jgi:hypothetical protein
MFLEPYPQTTFAADGDKDLDTRVGTQRAASDATRVAKFFALA